MNVSFWCGGALRSTGARRWAGVVMLVLAATSLPMRPSLGAPLADDVDAASATDGLAGSTAVLKLGTYGLTSGQFEAFLNAVSTADASGCDRPVVAATWFSAVRIVDGASDSRSTTAKPGAPMALIPMESGWYRAAFHRVRDAKESCWVYATQGDASAPAGLGGVGYDAGETYLRYESATRESEAGSVRSPMKSPDAFMLTASFPAGSVGVGNLR